MQLLTACVRMCICLHNFIHLLTAAKVYILDSRADSGQDIIHLNVGGTLYTTTRETLTKYPESRLHAMFKDNPTVICPKDERGNYFINRDGKTFQFILQFLSEESVLLTKYDNENLFLIEMSYFKIQFRYHLFNAVR